jgi:hypothetical protein
MISLSVFYELRMSNSKMPLTDEWLRVANDKVVAYSKIFAWAD